MTVGDDKSEDRPYEVDPLYEAVGRVAAFDSLLEQFLGDLYATLLQSPVAQHVAHGQGFAVTASAVQTLLDVVQPVGVDDLRTALARAGRLHASRNEVIHAVWLGVAGEPASESLRRRRWQPQPVTARWELKRLRQLAEDLLDHAWRVFDLTQAIKPDNVD